MFGVDSLDLLLFGDNISSVRLWYRVLLGAGKDLACTGFHLSTTFFAGADGDLACAGFGIHSSTKVFAEIVGSDHCCTRGTCSDGSSGSDVSFPISIFSKISSTHVALTSDHCFIRVGGSGGVSSTSSCDTDGPRLSFELGISLDQMHVTEPTSKSDCFGEEQSVSWSLHVGECAQSERQSLEPDKDRGRELLLDWKSFIEKGKGWSFFVSFWRLLSGVRGVIVICAKHSQLFAKSSSKPLKLFKLSRLQARSKAIGEMSKILKSPASTPVSCRVDGTRGEKTTAISV